MEYINQIVDKLGSGNVKFYGKLTPSDKYAQGIITEVHINDTVHKGPAVYFLINDTGELLKIGQTSCIHDRMFRQYKCVVNATNNRIREHIREVSPLQVYYISLEQHGINMFGYELKTSYASSLEYHLLKEFKETYGELPELNTMIK